MVKVVRMDKFVLMIL